MGVREVLVRIPDNNIQASCIIYNRWMQHILWVWLRRRMTSVPCFRSALPLFLLLFRSWDEATGNFRPPGEFDRERER